MRVEPSRLGLVPLKGDPTGTSLAAQWLRLHFSVLEVSVGLIPGRGAKIPHASQPKNQNIRQKQHCNKFKKDF